MDIFLLFFDVNEFQSKVFFIFFQLKFNQLIKYINDYLVNKSLND